ncbi:ASCH domain-containing protein [Microcella humidisoli]|uniref:ASCH domain-containing protein n=1 Tax=Microcella humidisoli TaxID=2963406 RepID=A0ABY5FTA4_9MICO|nr:ASCH domain-containing protein [Microcella humidisoli]UTT61516.1 ASCH domain-containing protein [Microcella humidisoli]
MRMLESEKAVLNAAEAVARTLGSSGDHSVAAAAMDIDGRIYTGVNMYHFTGGPCAELVVLGAVAASGGRPIMTMAAAGDGGRGLIAPCGRCRQVMLDTHPDAIVIVPTTAGPQPRTLRALLPDTYRFPDAMPPRLVRFNRRYAEAIQSGAKRMTIRFDDPLSVGPATLIFEDHPEFLSLAARVESVKSVPLNELTSAHAAAEGADSVDDLRDGLRNHYPGLPDDAVVDVVEFHLQLP